MGGSLHLREISVGYNIKGYARPDNILWAICSRAESTSWVYCMLGYIRLVTATLNLECGHTEKWTSNSDILMLCGHGLWSAYDRIFGSVAE